MLTPSDVLHSCREEVHEKLKCMAQTYEMEVLTKVGRDLCGGFYFAPIPKWTPLIRVSSAKKSYEGTRNGSLLNS